MTELAQVTRPAVRHFGGKWRLGPWIVEHLPPHDADTEIYCGGASVLLRKRPAKADRFRRVHEQVMQLYCRPWAEVYHQPLYTHDATARVVSYTRPSGPLGLRRILPAQIGRRFGPAGT